MKGHETFLRTRSHPTPRLSYLLKKNQCRFSLRIRRRHPTASDSSFSTRADNPNGIQTSNTKPNFQILARKSISRCFGYGWQVQYNSFLSDWHIQDVFGWRQGLPHHFYEAPSPSQRPRRPASADKTAYRHRSRHKAAISIRERWGRSIQQSWRARRRHRFFALRTI